MIDFSGWCRLEQAEERYQNREPRDQDLEVIDQLKGGVHRLEASVRQLTVSSIYFVFSVPIFLTFGWWIVI